MRSFLLTKRRYLIVPLALFLAASCLTSCERKKSIDLFIGGDTMLGRDLNRKARDASVSSIFRDVLPLIQQSDLAFVNLECVLSDQGRPVDKRPEHRPYFLRGRPGMARFLAEAGIDLVSQANNHGGDYGPDALVQDLAVLRSRGIQVIGAGENAAAARSSLVTEVNGLRIGWIAFSTQEKAVAAGTDLPGTFFVADKDILAEVVPLVRELRPRVDVLVVTAHWNRNWSTTPDPVIRQAARGLIDAGVDIIAGHSSHVFHGAEIYKGKAILYDIGSLLFDRTADKRIRESLVVNVHMEREGPVRLDIHPVFLYPGAVQRASPGVSKRIMDAFIKRSGELDGDFLKHLTSREDDMLSIQLIPRPAAMVHGRGHSRQQPQGRGKPLPLRPSCFIEETGVLNRLPQPLPLGKGIEYLGSDIPKEVPFGFSFVMRNYLRLRKDSGPAPDPLLELVLSIKQPGKKDAAAVYSYQPGDWACPVDLWQKDDIIVDEYVVRVPSKLEQGPYELYLSVGDLPVKAGDIEVVAASVDSHCPGLVKYGK